MPFFLTIFVHSKNREDVNLSQGSLFVSQKLNIINFRELVIGTPFLAELTSKNRFYKAL